MELLDASQAQPRDQSGHNHLFGAPSSQPFLLAPQEAAPGQADEQESFSYLFDISSSGRHKHGEPAVRSRSNSEDSDCELAAPHERADGRRADLSHAKAVADYGQEARMSMKRFSSSALCLNEADANTKAPGRAKPASQRQRPAIVLNEQHELAAAISTPKHQRAAANVCTKFEASAKPSLLAAPEDPVVQLARQRRPSASNQGSINVEQQALFSAVECNQLERTKTILDEAKVNVNSLNGDKLSCLDVAVLLRNADMVRLLQRYRAKESSAYLTREGRENQLYALYMDARRLVKDLSRSIEAIAPGESLQQSSLGGQQTGDANQPAPGAEQQLMLATGSLLSSALFEEKQRQLQYWKRRLELFMQMRYGYAKLQVPNAPELAVLQVVGESSLGVKIVHSLQYSELFAQQHQQHQHQQQRQQSAKSEHQAAEPLAELANLARSRLLDCPLGSKCTHWLMDEFQALKQSDQMLNAVIGSRARDPQSSLNCQLPLRHQERSSRSSNSGATQISAYSDSKKQQERLAVFNCLLAQQLAILNNEQRQQQVQELLEQSSYLKLRRSRQFKDQEAESEARGAKPAHNRQLMLAHQIESTDSAYEHIAAASVRQQQQQQVNLLAIHPTYSLQMSSSPYFKLGAASRPLVAATNLQRQHAGSSKRQCEQHTSERQPVAYHSLAFELMSARRHNANNFCAPHGQAPTLSALASANVSLAAAAAAAAAGSAAADPNKMTVITKYKIEWSPSEQFEEPLNSMIIYNTNSYPIECQINQLANGQLFYVRVSSGNQRGFSEPRSTTPPCLAPSSWRQVSAGAPADGSEAGAGSGRRKLKYDEQLFKKFTKLILLNKHILEEHQINLLQREQHHLLTSGARPPLGRSAAKRAGLQHSGPQNKSSLINMLLLDATMPTVVSGQVTGEPLDLKPIGMSAATHSPRGSLYPMESAGGGANGDPQAQQHQQQQQLQAGLKVKKNIKNLFQFNSAKFHKLNNQNKRGLYLTSLIYHSQIPTAKQSKQAGAENKIVVTNDDRLPVIEIMNDLVSPSNLMADFYWLLKINGTKWIDIKRLRQQLQKSHSSSTLHLRIKLLNAIEQMQLALNLEDIGRLFYKPIQAHDGSIIICTCRQVASLKMVSNLSIKWTGQHKLIPRHLRKISAAISLQSSQQRELQQQQATLTFGALMPTASSAKRHSSSATSGGNLTSGSVRGELETSGAGLQTALAMRQEQSCGALPNLACESGSGLTGYSARPPHVNAPELSRLCEPCQQAALNQRRCTMASASSSSSLASNESQSTWSSSQFSLSSQALQQPAPSQQQQQQLGGKRSCACSRPSSTTIQVNSVASSSTTPTPTQSQPNQLSAANAPYAQGLAASAPNSQRNSSSARSSSGSIMMLMAPAQRHQSGGSLSMAPGMFAASGGSFSSTSSAPFASIGQRQTQSQHWCASTPQKSSTYLMLASLSPYDLLLFHLDEIIDFDQSSVVPLKRGLYLGFIQLQTTVESMRLLVPRKRPNMIPCTRIRDNAHVSREEWQLLKEFGPLFGGTKTRSQYGDGVESEPSVLRQASKSSSSRSSDPAIWSLGTPAPAAPSHLRASQLQTDCSLLGANLNADAAGFDRDRAKSVSPGLVGAGGACDDADSESKQLRRAKQRAVDAKEAAMATVQRNEKMAHSDSDLQAGESRRDSSDELHHSDSSNLYQAMDATEALSASSQQKLRQQQQQQQEQRQRRFSRAKRHSQIGASQSPEMTFVRLIGDAAKRLLCELKSQLPKSFQQETRSWRSLLGSLNEEENNRVYHMELIELSNQVTFVLLIPTPENICPVTSHDKSDLLTNNNSSDYMLLPLQIFETIHLNTYEPDLLGKYSRLSTILETDLIVAQHNHRQAFSSSEVKSTKSRVSRLQDMVGIADEFWRQLRWIVDVVSFARDKTQHTATETQANGASSAPGCLKVGLIWRHFDSVSSISASVEFPPGAGAMEDSAMAICQRHISETHAEEEEIQEESARLGEEEPVDSNHRRTRCGRDVKRTLSAYQRQRDNQSARSGAIPIGAGHHYSSSGALASDCFGANKAGTKLRAAAPPPRLPQIQLPSGEARDSSDDSLLALDGLQRSPGVKRRKNSNRVGRLLSASSLQRRPRQHAYENEPPAAFALTGARRHSDQGARGNTPATSRLLDGHEETAHYYAPGQRSVETNNRSRLAENESCFEDSILNVDFDQCLRPAVFGGQLPEGVEQADNGPKRGSQNDGLEDVEASAQDVDEEAIYAYHISLRDATKRASRRKSTQHAINVFLVEGEEMPRSTSSSSGPAQTNPPAGQIVDSTDPLDSQPSEPDDGTQMIEFQLAGRSRQLATNVIDLKFMHQRLQQSGARDEASIHQTTGLPEWDEDVTHVTSESTMRSAKITGYASNGPRTLGHFKTNNPFLSDSFDL